MSLKNILVKYFLLSIVLLLPLGVLQADIRSGYDNNDSMKLMDDSDMQYGDDSDMKYGDDMDMDDNDDMDDDDDNDDDDDDNGDN